MKANGVELFAVVFVTVFFMGVLSVMIDDNRYLKIDCRYAEISPDISPDIRELCRKLKK